MYLKNLTIHGFKSFANRTTLEFPSNLLGIVGPNGSGKSNICDSIRWVLGEQSSKALRGQKMDDVIFGGTSTAPPAKFSEVRLTFDNKSRFFKVDSDEFILTRKIYRTGDSEYIINGEQCRLKDIKEKIMDTGLGRDAYSIIGQGMVDNIISSPRGNERRAIIEEAAGIVKYKADKNESLRKIADTQVNIDRLSDLILELEKQLGPLSLAAQVAQRYLAIEEQLRNKKMKKLVYEFDAQCRELSLKKATVGEYHKKREEHTQKVIVFTAEVEAMQAKVVTLNDKNAQIKKDNYDIIVEQESLQNIEKDLLTKITEINANRESYVRTVDEVGEKIEALENENKSIETDISSTEEYLKSLDIEIKQHQEDISSISARLKSSEKTLNVSEDTTYESINELAGAKNSLNQYEGELKFTEQQIKKLEFEMIRLEDRIKEYALKNTKGSSEQQTNRQKHTELKKRFSEINEKLQGLFAEEKQLLKTIQDNTGELITARAQLKAQEDVRKNFDGFARGVKCLMDAKTQRPDQFKGICGLVTELVSVIPEYETAIEVALGGNMQSVVMEKARDTEPCIDFLKKTNGGRVTFLPLDTVRPGNPGIIPSGLKGFIGIATDLVKFDKKYQSIFEYLLNPVLVVDTLKNATEFATKNRFSGRIVTLGGELIASSGAITGGSLAKSSGGGHFSNSGNTEMLKSRAVYLDDKINQDNIKLDAVRKKIDALKSENETVKTEMTRLAAILETSEESGVDYAQMLKNSESEMSAMVEELEGHKKNKVRLEAEIEKYKKIVTALEEKSRAFHENVKKNKSSQQEERETYAKLSAILTDKKVEQASTTTKLNNFRKKIIDNKNEIEKLDKRTRVDQGTLTKFEEAYRENSVKLSDVVAKLEVIKSKTSTIEAQKEEITKELDTLATQIRIKENLIASRNKQSMEMLTKIHEFEIQQTEIEINIKNINNTLETEYKIRESDFPAYRDETFKYETAADEIAELQQNRDRLGIVNISAIEDYKTLQQRVNELKTQRDDLVSARDAIYKIVEKTDAECTKLFMETFNKINEFIGEIFQLLFNGGSARLVLEDESKPLECNIDIKAQPPGKKLQSITLMSGGEKSLTALSLLFSILRIKPSPFCILDEVEAALDEFNVLRFVKMLDNFKDKTQFLIITHNKQTMQHLDLLYGVTMEEKGISKIISVRLEQAYDIIDMNVAKASAAAKSMA
ncbi:MAG: Chromosome partition protein Smc [bacterium ADurb.Bin243]|nr:MAG: Chromosome partition protein Smc [bacterium ADurb.Bin243]